MSASKPFFVSVVAVVATGLAAQDAGSTSARTKLGPAPADRREGFDSIKPDLCKQWLSYLASDELEGRETGKPGYKKAAEFIAKKFAEFGLEPVGDNGTYFQEVPFEIVSADPSKTSLSLYDKTGKSVLEIAAGKGFGGTVNEKSNRELALTVIVAESGSDVRDVDLKDTALILVDRSPELRRGLSEARMALFRARPGATIVVDDKVANRSLAASSRVRYVGRTNRGRRGRFRRPNQYALTHAAAERLLDAAGIDAEVLSAKQRTVERAKGFTLKAHCEVSAKPTFAANVVGFLKGRDATPAKEIVGIGSHLDHIGISRDGQINNGADDDGSGTTGVLAVAHAFFVNKIRPRRSILFMCFSGEEKGLIGSGHYANNPIFPNSRMVAELQMDMIGRHEEKVNRRTGEVTEAAEDNVNTLHLVGTKKLSNELHDICIEMNEKFVGFDFEFDEEGVFFRSDHVNFARKDIPIAFFFTGFHPQYHRPDDTIEKIDFPKLARVAKLCYSIAFELAERESRPKLDRRWKDVQQGRRRR